MPSIAAMPAGWRLREVLNVKTGVQIANVYAGLTRTKPALWCLSSRPMIVGLKSAAIAVSRFGGRHTRHVAQANKHSREAAKL